MTTESLNNTYVFRLSSLGDLVLCTPLLKALARDPARRIHFVTEKRFAAFVESSSPVASLRVVAIESEPRGLLKFFRAGWCEAQSISAQQSGPIEIFDLHGVLKSHLWIWGFRLAALRRGLHVRIRQTPKKGWRRLLSVWIGRDLLGPRHIFREHLALVDPISMESPELRICAATTKQDHAMPSPALGPRKILIAPDAQHWKKRWPVPHWELLLKKILRETDWELTLVGGARALPLDLIDELTLKNEARVHNLLGQTRIEELASIAVKQDATVCGNSAWLHISEAVGTPVVALAGPIVPGFGFSPWHPASRELSVDNLHCRPCTRHGGGPCILKDERFHACMKDISPDLVFATLKSRVEGST